tara:strand:+ start:2535 stop:3203 length:669 start_codon:yes stop_codon:yes gene_type:complete
MCGRYTQYATWDELVAYFDMIPTQAPNLKARYNVAPTQDAPVVRLGTSGRKLSSIRWSLVPSWSKEPRSKYNLINARLESASEKPSFRSAFKSRRCLVPADGWYEWKTEEDGKQPYYIQPEEERLFAFAGIWERWDGAEGAFDSFAILTTEALEPLQLIHHRMPVVITDRDRFGAWIDPETPQGDLHGLLDMSDITFKHVAVNRAVNNARHDAPDCIEPLAA